MRLQVKSGFDYVHLQLLAVVLVMIGVGAGIYYFGNLYGSRAQITHIVRAPSVF
jgi:hypothetical protein